MSPAATSVGRLVVFAKDPRAGEVKTRLCPPLSREQAAAVYRAMLDDVLTESAHACDALALEGVVAFHPEAACARFAEREASRAFAVIAQRGPDLAARMSHAVSEGFAAGARRVILRGSDNPLLGTEQISEILRQLEVHDLVVVPDLDGGYGAIGLRGPAPGLFAHAMSTDSVLDDTLRNAHALGLATSQLEPGYDLDTPADLRRLRDDALATRALAPRTLAQLEAEPVRSLLGRDEGGG